MIQSRDVSWVEINPSYLGMKPDNKGFMACSKRNPNSLIAKTDVEENTQITPFDFGQYIDFDKRK